MVNPQPSNTNHSLALSWSSCPHNGLLWIGITYLRDTSMVTQPLLPRFYYLVLTGLLSRLQRRSTWMSSKSALSSNNFILLYTWPFSQWGITKTIPFNTKTIQCWIIWGIQKFRKSSYIYTCHARHHIAMPIYHIPKKAPRSSA